MNLNPPEVPDANVPAARTATSEGSDVTRLEHRLRQIDRLLMQDALTRDALMVLLAEKRALMETLGGEALHS
ncbi:MAG TPA: hypothetical protein VK013_06625 [Myxococcaceae bacterium]|nr:hypothetical protein [Myxococcaceae bacterium]